MQILVSEQEFNERTEELRKLKARVKELEEALRDLNQAYFRPDGNLRHGETVEGP